MRSGSAEGDGWRNWLGLTISRASGCFNHAFIVRTYRLVTLTASAATITQLNLSVCVISTL
jgi:hypothetical protein